MRKCVASLKERTEDFVTAVDEKNIIVVKEVDEMDSISGSG